MPVTLPTLTPGTGKARKCYLWAYAVDNRPFGGSGPIMVAFRFEDSRAGDCVAELGAPNQATKDVISRWFIDAHHTDKLDEAATKLNDGMKKIWAGTGSTTLVFTDYLDWRYTDRVKTFGAAIAGGEGGGFPVIYLEGAFTKLAGSADKLRAQTGVEVEQFAYPFGAWTRSVARLVADLGFRGGYTTEGDAISWRSSPHALPRVPAENQVPGEFASVLADLSGR